VYLFPKESCRGPSFKVPAFVVASSQVFNDLIQAELSTPTSARGRAKSFGGRDSLMAQDATRRRASPPTSPPSSGSETPGETRLYLPAPSSQNGPTRAPGLPVVPTTDRLVAVRNLFAFLTGQPLVATKSHPTVFTALLGIANLLYEFGFTNFDGSSFGEAVDLSFGFYMGQVHLADVRQSREKTLESLILGERMRSMELYSEAFAHAVGKYSAIMDLRSPLFEQLSMYTRQKLERAHLDLVNRQHNVNIRVEQFEFPSLFAGIANSTSDPALRQVRFKQWRNAFGRMRSFVLGYYKSAFGNWPPKASSKKNPFSESGLNRLVLRVLYSDMCALYDLIVDRQSLTPRVIDEAVEDVANNDTPTISALRKMLSEFDHSSPPVLPPIPFDIPMIPTMTAILETYNDLPAKEQARFNRRIKEHELTLVLNKAYNYDTNVIEVPFLAQFKEFEMKESRGKSAADLADQRIGIWVFLYVVIQSLPMLVIDAPGLTFTEGVEYFLCEPPIGHPPWVEDAQQVRKMWYEVSGGAGIVELSADAVMFSVEGVYHRSHCWAAAKRWEGSQGPGAPPPIEAGLSPLEPPRPVFPGVEPGMVASPPPLSSGGPSPQGSPQFALRPRNMSPTMVGNRMSQHSHRSSIALGLEPISLDDVPHDRHSRVFSIGHNRSSSLGPPRGSLPRSVSVGNLHDLTINPRITEQEQLQNTGITFDDILGGAENKKTKKKSRFF
jgi:hypothetical protein